MEMIVLHPMAIVQRSGVVVAVGYRTHRQRRLVATCTMFADMLQDSIDNSLTIRSPHMMPVVRCCDEAPRGSAEVIGQDEHGERVLQGAGPLHAETESEGSALIFGVEVCCVHQGMVYFGRCSQSHKSGVMAFPVTGLVDRSPRVFSGRVALQG